MSWGHLRWPYAGFVWVILDEDGMARGFSTIGARDAWEDAVLQRPTVGLMVTADNLSRFITERTSDGWRGIKHVPFVEAQ